VAWLTREKAPLEKSEKVNTPDGLWHRCSKCLEIAYHQDFIDNRNVCPKCNHHFPMAAMARVKHFLDHETIELLDEELRTSDPLAFKDSKTYKARLAASEAELGRPDAFVSARGKLGGRFVQLGVFDFEFMGGSMGTVVGEKIARVFQRAAAAKEPAIIVTASGGARMQEGILSLMQMSKTCAALALLREKGVPFISVLTHPTTGGVAASFAMLGDVNIAEPGALIGFAGPRVIQQTIGEKLPEGFQRSEYLLDHGMLDMICHRDALPDRISAILSMLYPQASS
jgi:acetyl-CoA carboxylase carboxyl transferase subunit beta